MNAFKTIVEQKTDKELFDIYIKSQDYQPEFIKVVEKELAKRNIPLDSVKKIKEEADTISNNKIKLGVQGNTFYIALCFLSAILGGVISIVAGYIYAFSKRENLEGVACYYYNEQTRKYGKWMLLIGVIMLLVYVFIGL
jgi:hypothetical protein